LDRIRTEPDEIPAPPRPATARPTINFEDVMTMVHRRDLTSKTQMLTTNSSLVRSRLYSLPKGNMKLAVVNDYAEEYHPISSTVLKWFARLGTVAATMFRSNPNRIDTVHIDAIATHSFIPEG
jgi:hypothetical protein